MNKMDKLALAYGKVEAERQRTQNRLRELELEEMLLKRDLIELGRSEDQSKSKGRTLDRPKGKTL